MASRLVFASALAFAGMVFVAAQPVRRPSPYVEVSAGPLIGIDRPLKGCSGDLEVGLRLEPFEAEFRAGSAYDFSLASGALRLDLEIGLGSGLRAIVGGLLPFGALLLADPSAPEGARIAVRPGAWPDRFGLGATIAELPWRPLRARLGIEAELVYTAYSLDAGDALSGAAAFAAAVEAKLALRFRWGAP